MLSWIAKLLRRGDRVAPKEERVVRSLTEVDNAVHGLNKMEAVVAPQAVMPGEIGGTANQGFVHAQNLPRLSLDVEVPPQIGRQRFRSANVGRPREHGASLHVSNGMRDDQLPVGNCPPDPGRVRFLREQLHKCGRIQVEDHPRCSLAISNNVFSSFPISIRGLGNAGFLPLLERTHGKLRERATPTDKEPDGNSKAVFFMRFGFRVDEWETLAAELRKVGTLNPVGSVVRSPHGTRYTAADALHHARSHACSDVLTFDDRRYVRRTARLGLKPQFRLLAG